jgi:PHP family Zn ribbon phosphoesterase
MQLVADLHLHSRYASGVSPAMTVENIATWALRKGLNLMGTGDCPQPA